MPTISLPNSSHNISTTNALNTENETEMNAKYILISVQTTDILNTNNKKIIKSK